jgi:hypothetical protein
VALFGKLHGSGSSAPAGLGSIAEAARRFPLSGPVMGQRTRVLTAEFVLRAVIVMMLLPQASYTAVMTVLAGDLVLVPWAQDWRRSASGTCTCGPLTAP